MNRVFASFVDIIALGGSGGYRFLDAVHTVLGPNPDPALVAWIISQLRNRPTLFTSPDFDAPPENLLVIACESVRNRALGFNERESPNVMPQSRKLLEAIGRAGPRGVLQSDLAKIVDLTSVMVHHYLVSLFSYGLISRKRVVLTRKRDTLPSSTAAGTSAVENPSEPGSHYVHTDENTDGEIIVSKRPCDMASSVLVTYTSVLVLVRFQTLLESCNLANAFSSLKHGVPNSSPDATTGNSSHSKEKAPVVTKESASVSVFDMTGDISLRRIIDTLRSCSIRAERDLKYICLPDSEMPSGTTKETFRHNRHRKFRIVRNRLIRLGIVKVTRRKCRTPNGKITGKIRCLKLTRRARRKGAVEEILRDANQSNGQFKQASSGQEGNRPKASSGIPKKLHPLLVGYQGPAFVSEVDAIEQVYQTLELSGPIGISVPEVDAFLDGGSCLTGMSQKRIRNLIKAISRNVDIVESQYFEGRAMFLRYTLKKFVGDTSGGQSTERQPSEVAGQSPAPPLRRRKAGLTMLGEQRQKIVLDLLKEKTVIAYDVLGKDVAKIEGNQVVRIDRKVMRRIIDSLLEKKQVRVITATKPCVKGNKKWDSIRLLTLPHIQESDPEVREFISLALSRLLHGRPSATKSGDPEKEENGCNEDVDVEEDSDRNGEDTNSNALSNSRCRENHGALFQNKQATNCQKTTMTNGRSCDLAKSTDDGGKKRDHVNKGDQTAVVVDSDDDTDKDDGCSDDGGKCDEEGEDDDEDSDDEDEIVDVKYVKEFVRKPFARRGYTKHAPSDDLEKATASDGISSHPVQDEIEPVLPTGPKRRRKVSVINARRTDLSENNTENDNDSALNDLQANPTVGSTGKGRVAGKKRKNLLSQESLLVAKSDNTTQAMVPDASKRETVFVETGYRDSRNSRIARLRAIDYGWMKGTMARARLFHKLLFKHVFAGNPGRGNGECSKDRDLVEKASVSISDGKKLPPVGKFTIFSYIRDITVEEYAATVGICNNIKDLIETSKKKRIGEVIDVIKPELNSAYAARRLTGLVQVLSVLGLMEPRDGSFWTLCGAGIIRDFGKGLPPGIEPHAIPFSSGTHVNVYWRELRKLSQFRLPTSASEPLVTHKSSQDSYEEKLREVYLPAAWFTGVVHEFSLYEQLLFECILQRLCGVDVSPISLDLSGPGVICSTLRSFTIEEIVDELDRVSVSNQYIGKRRKYTNISEGLLKYARMRTTVDIPRKVRQCEEEVREELKKISCAKAVPAYHKGSVLRVKRAEGGMKIEEATKAISNLTRVEQVKQGKSIMKKKMKIDESPVVTVIASDIVPLLKKVIRYGSIAYCSGGTEMSDWRNTATKWLNKEHRSTDGDVTLPQNQHRAVTAFCHCMLLRLGFDILSLQLVLRLEELCIREKMLLKSLDIKEVETLADKVIESWQNLDDIICGLMIEASNEMEREWRTIVNFQQWAGGNFDSKSVASPLQKMLLRYFSPKYRLRNMDQSLSNLLSVMSARYRQVASLRMKKSILLGVLLSTDQCKEDEYVDVDLGLERREGLTEDKIAETEKEIHRKPSCKDDVINSAVPNKGSSAPPEVVCEGMKEIAMPDDTEKLSIRTELAEIAVCAILRQDRNEQWTEESKNLLKRFATETLCLARDRLLLSEVIVMLENHDENRRHLSIVKGERGSGPSDFLSVVDGEDLEKKWFDDLVRTCSENGSHGVSADKTVICRDVRSITPTSSFAASVMTRLSIFGDATHAVDMNPSFERGDGGEGKCIVKINCRRRAPVSNGAGISSIVRAIAGGRSTSESSKIEAASSAISQLLDRRGWQGLMIHELLEQAEEYGLNVVDEADIFIHALRDMVQRKDIYRLAVETVNGEWNVNDGGLFLSPLHGRKIESTQGMITGWTSISGQTDVTLVRESATAILEFVMKRPGIDIAAAIGGVASRFPWVPRRALADLVFGLVRDGFIRVNSIVRNGIKWVNFDRLDRVQNIDEVSIISWKRRVKVTLKSVPERIRGGKTWAGIDQHMNELVKAYTNKETL